MSAKIEVEYTEYLKETCDRLRSPGALLTSLDEAGKPNTMAIGWGTVGIVWSRPMFVVLVRPSRYTYSCIEATGDFTVDVPTAGMAEVVEFCGTVSGRDHDKFAEKSLTAAPGLKVKSPIIEECPVCFECKVVQNNDVIPDRFEPAIVSQCYPQGDFHRVYFGEILTVRADADARQKLQ